MMTGSLTLVGKTATPDVKFPTEFNGGWMAMGMVGVEEAGNAITMIFILIETVSRGKATGIYSVL